MAPSRKSIRGSKKKPQFARKIIQDKILEFEFLIQCGGTYEQAALWLKKRYNFSNYPSVGDEARGKFAYYDSYPYASVIHISEGSMVQTISHEVHHAVMHVCKVLEVDPIKADEFGARYQGYLTQEICAIIGNIK